MLTSVLRNKDLWRKSALVNGSWVDAESKEKFPVYNPATTEVVGYVPALSAKETKTAIEGAHAAWHTWRSSWPKERSEILKKWQALIIENAKDLAAITATELGRPLPETEEEIWHAAESVGWFAEEAVRSSKPSVGVVGLWTPWNYPCATMARKVSAALAAGCCVVVKPSEETPFTALALGWLAEKAGVPR